MAKSFTPSFAVPKAIAAAFVTNNPLGENRVSAPVQINMLSFNENTRSIEAVCSDKKMRQCRIDRFQDDTKVRALTKKLQKAFTERTLICFTAAGANDPNVWFFDIADAA